MNLNNSWKLILSFLMREEKIHMSFDINVLSKEYMFLWIYIIPI
ncbi:MAG: hypothetical protein AB6733_06950 [Clostridiaceae bacterium]